MSSKYLQTIAHALVIVSVLLALIAAALWFRTGSLETPAAAQMRPVGGREGVGGIPDDGKQRMQMIEQLETMNRHLADIERALRDGSCVVQTIEAKGSPRPAAKNEARESQK